MPTSALNSSAVPVTLSDSQMISNSAGSRIQIRRKASARPRRMSSISVLLHRWAICPRPSRRRRPGRRRRREIARQSRLPRPLTHLLSKYGRHSRFQLGPNGPAPSAVRTAPKESGLGDGIVGVARMSTDSTDCDCIGTIIHNTAGLSSRRARGRQSGNRRLAPGERQAYNPVPSTCVDSSVRGDVDGE
jgi:hypothetical protein